MEEKQYWLIFAVCHGIGPAKFHKLLVHFGSAKEAWPAEKSDLIESGIGQKTATDFIEFRKRFSPSNYFEKMKKLQISYVTSFDEKYPAHLRDIPNPPFVLFCKGNLDLLTEETKIAVVGTRKVTGYGRQVTELIVSELAQAGSVIVSGLAMGVDAIAHQTTLDNNGKTIAVLGSGVDYCTPRENEQLYERIIAENGLIISETPLGQMPNKGSFPMRNRIIAGMSAGVVVTEGAEDSGSLITAKNALSYDRHVFAVPGPITSQVSKGPLSLIADGAVMITSAKDIFAQLGITKGIPGHGKTKIKGETSEEQMIIDLLENEAKYFDELVRESGIASSEVGTLLSLMEMKGVVMQDEVGKFLLK